MNVIATIQADLDRTPIGTKSRLAEELAGETILRRTVDRVSRTPSISAVYAFCPNAQRDRCMSLLRGSGATVCEHDAARAPWAALVETARKWSLDGWRGGIGGATSFDEYTDVRLIGGLLERVRADAVLVVSPAAALFDPALGERIIAHRRNIADAARISFVQAPPGLTALLLDADLVKELAEKSAPVGAVFGYKPDAPQKDLTFEPCCCPTPVNVRFAAGRVIADTERAIARMRDLLRTHEEPDAETIGRWLIQRDETQALRFPSEVELELTTEDPFPDTLLRPRGPSVARRGPIPLAIIERLVRELRQRDDSLCVLGGFGDPLRHGDLRSVLEKLRPQDDPDAGVYGLAIRTTAVDLTEEAAEAVIDHRVDVLNVSIDAWTQETYARVHRPGDQRGADLKSVLDRLDTLAALKADRRSVRPIIVPEICKARDNVDDLDGFYDGWMRKLGTACITGYSHHSRQLEDHSVICMAPSARTPCRRIRSRCLVLADGRVPLCDQDFLPANAVGNVCDETLTDIWDGKMLAEVRAGHQQRRFDVTKLCIACDEWHRP